MDRQDLLKYKENKKCEMKIDFEGHRIIVQEQTIWLSKTSNTILKLLYTNKGKVVPYQDIVKTIYQLELDDTLKRLIRRHITILRQKVNQYIKIKTVRDVGYIVEED